MFCLIPDKNKAKTDFNLYIFLYILLLFYVNVCKIKTRFTTKTECSKLQCNSQQLSSQTI